jgi:hypothetical protein
MPAHLFVDISSHGLGHLSQVAPVLTCLRQRLPALRLTIRSGLSRDRLQRRIAEPFAHIEAASDFGFVMHNAVDIDFAASAERYRLAHADWDNKVSEDAELLQRLGIDAVFANAAYRPLAAARQAGIFSVGMCSLNWADLFAHYFSSEPWAAALHQQILAAYNAANEFLCVTPGLAMHAFDNRRVIGPVAAVLPDDPRRRQRLAAALHLDANARWVLVAMGGMEFRLPVESWPAINGTIWLCPSAWDVQRPDLVAFDSPDSRIGFDELLATADVVLTKPGYGTFVEAACHGTPVLYVPRDNWPEEAPLCQWLHACNRALAVSRQQVMAGELSAPLAAIGTMPVPVRPEPRGIAEATACLLERLT